MIRYVPLILVIVLTIYSMIDCLQVGADEVRNAPKWAWLLLILLFPIVGAIAYLVAGRPLAAPRSIPPSQPRPRSQRPIVAPDDDPTFLASIRELNTSHERVLDEWEADLRRREQELKERKERQEKEPGTGESDAR